MPQPRPHPQRRTAWPSAPRRTLAGAALVAVAGLAGGVMAVTAEPGGARAGITVTDAGPFDQPETSRPPARPGTATVTLITGDQVRVDTAADGHQDAGIVGAANDTFAAPAVEFSFAGDQYVVPGEAVPYLGGVLDPALFNVSYLVRAKLDDASNRTLPVTVEEAGARAADLPAVRVTSVTDGRAAAEVAKDAAGAFGARLGQVWQASRAGTSATPTGQLPGIERITLAAPRGTEPAPELPLGRALTGSSPGAGTPDTRTAPKAARYRTITLDPIDRSGRPAPAVGFLHNLDNPQAYATLFNTAGAGAVTLSVPEGTYSAQVTVLEGPADDLRTPGTLVVEPEFAVTADRTITLDARRGVPYRPTVDPDVQPGYRTDRLILTRVNQAHEGSSSWGAFVSLGMRLYSVPELGSPTLHITPTAPVSRGQLELLGHTTFSDNAAGSVNPGYVFAYRWERAIPATLSPAVPRAELTTVRSELYRSPSGPEVSTVQMAAATYTPLTRTVVLPSNEVPFGVRVDYWYTNAPDTVWFDTPGTGVRRIRPGEEIHRVWNKAPVAPPPTAPYLLHDPVIQFGTGVLPDHTGCVACRQDDNGFFSALPFSGSSPDQFSFEFYRNGTLVMSSRNAVEFDDRTDLLLPMLPEPASYRVQWDLSRENDPQAWVRTGWTFSSSRTDPAGDVPCVPDRGRPCSFLPLLFVGYDLPVNLDGRAPAGAPFDLTFHIGHQQHQPAPAGVSATVSVSYDGGATWSEPIAATDRGDGRFSATVTHPQLASTDGFVALRVQARDAAGNAVDQTITRAYGLTG